MGLLDFFRRKPKAVEQVDFDDIEVSRILSDGRLEKIRWDDLGEVTIVTTNEEPFVEDVYFVLTSINRKKGCAIPQGAKGASDLLTRLQTLPNFDNEAVIAAMQSTDNARFVCWKRS